MKKRFGIDIDGTVTCPTSLIPFINDAFQLNITLNDLTVYELTENLDIPKDEFYEWYQRVEPEIYSQSPLADGAKDVLSKWKNRHELYYITARRKTVREVTTSWFHTHNIHYDHVELVGSHDKVETAKAYDIDLFFEDKHDNAVNISEQLNIPVILFDTPYNRLPIPEKVVRVYSWKEAEDWVNEWLKTGAM